MPPPARGWPCASAALRSPASGAPARAGMAPCLSTGLMRVLRCPRPRGDGPVLSGLAIMQFLVPPPARGWPREHRNDPRPERGAPARAGMALHRCGIQHAFVRCPRPRGDGPLLGGSIRTSDRVPPPARGWPLHTAEEGSNTLGAPARAGMAPRMPNPLRPLSRCPRPRGDGPLLDDAVVDVEAVPPPARGWPRNGPHAGIFPAGAPARAGMARPVGSSAAWCRGCPRPRGDGPCRTNRPGPARPVPPPARGWPCHGHRRALPDLGAPARAGMAPWKGLDGAFRTRCPRPRGDGPDQATDDTVLPEVPPPARGWPPARPPRSAPRRGAPARAGMAPRRGTQRQKPIGCPRPRGDGPPALTNLSLSG